MAQGYNVEGKFYCQADLNKVLPQCHTCGKLIQGNYVAVSEKRVSVCLPCRENLKKCFLCYLPSDPNSGGASLPDGRSICREHASLGVTDPHRAARLFEQSGTEVQRILGHRFRLKQPLQEVKLVDLAGLKEVASGTAYSAGLQPGQVLGITTLVFVSHGDRHWLEPATIHLLDHVPADRMLSVAAHEYAHVWHAENHQNYTTTTPILREGFAEWVAYVVCRALGRGDQLQIMENPSGGIYYQGLMRFLDLEKKNGVGGVIEFATTSTTI